MEIPGEDAAGDGIAVQANHKVHDGCPVADADNLVRGFVAEQLLGKVGGFIGPLDEVKPGIGLQVLQGELFPARQRVVPAEEHVRPGGKELVSHFPC